MISYSIKAETNAGKSKSNAKLMKVQQTMAEGYFTSADKSSKVDWFKFTLKSDQYVQLYMSYFLDGEFDYEIIDSNGKVLYQLSHEVGSSEGYYDTWCGKNFKKGTYYIKVYKKGNFSSVNYVFKIFDFDYASYKG